MASACSSISSARSESRPGRVSMLTLMVPVSSAVISSVSIPLARANVITTSTTDKPMTMALWRRRRGTAARYRSCIRRTGPFIGACCRSLGL